jgi:hypothetical protein
MRKSIAIFAFAVIAPLVAYAGVMPPVGLAASVNVDAPNVIVGGNAEDDPVIADPNRDFAVIRLQIKELKARLALADPKKFTTRNMKRQLKQLEEQIDEAERREQLDKREWRWREWRIVPL